jgi:hypothetical protein
MHTHAHGKTRALHPALRNVYSGRPRSRRSDTGTRYVPAICPCAMHVISGCRPDALMRVGRGSHWTLPTTQPETTSVGGHAVGTESAGGRNAPAGVAETTAADQESSIREGHRPTFGPSCSARPPLISSSSSIGRGWTMALLGAKQSAVSRGGSALRWKQEMCQPMLTSGLRRPRAPLATRTPARQACRGLRRQWASIW